MHGAREIGLRTGESHPRPLAHKSHLNSATMHPGAPSKFCFTEPVQHLCLTTVRLQTRVYRFDVIVDVTFGKGQLSDALSRSRCRSRLSRRIFSRLLWHTAVTAAKKV